MICSARWLKFNFQSYSNEILYFSDQAGKGPDLSKHSFLLVIEVVLQQSVSAQCAVVPYTTDIRADLEEEAGGWPLFLFTPYSTTLLLLKVRECVHI